MSVLADNNDKCEKSKAYLHDFDLSVSLSLRDVFSRFDEVANEFTGGRRAELCRIVLLSDENSARIDRKTESSAETKRIVREDSCG
jgi:hypothetical protein